MTEIPQALSKKHQLCHVATKIIFCCGWWTLVANVISLTITAGEEACSDASDAENRDPWDLSQPVPCACHTLLIDHASLVSASAGSLAAHAGLSTQTQPLSCWVTR